MKLSRIKINPVRIIETVPALLFLILWRAGLDIQTAAWIGCAMATVATLGLVLTGQRLNPIALGLNIYMMLAIPLILITIEVVGRDSADFLIRNAETGVLVVMFLTGLVMTIFTRNGFLNEPGVQRAHSWRLSVLLLISVAGLIAFSIQMQHIPFLAVGGPLIVLFLLRDYLVGQAPRDDASEQET
jgi:hypothetical protein